MLCAMKFKFVPIFVLLFLSSRVLAQERINYEAPSLVGHSLRVMKTAGFWISHHPSPDAVIMSPDAIDQFNGRLRNENKLTKDIFTIIQDFKTESLVADFDKILSDITEKGFYTAAGVRNDPDFIEAAKRNMDLSGVVIGVAPRY